MIELEAVCILAASGLILLLLTGARAMQPETCYCKAWECICTECQVTQASRNFEKLLHWLYQYCECLRVSPEEDILTVGLVVPGIIDAARLTTCILCVAQAVAARRLTELLGQSG